MHKFVRRRRLQVRLPVDQFAAGEECATRSGISFAAFVQLLLEDALAGSPTTVSEALANRGEAQDRVSLLSCLVATENTGLMVERILPRGRDVRLETGREALSRAEDRLEEVRRHLEGEGI